ncbi:hypothetical protein PN473_18120 [Dolichospermum circinale CS-545/17]|nr:hypothetical protein [Dolichospermum circinale CS-545/17]
MYTIQEAKKQLDMLIKKARVDIINVEVIVWPATDTFNHITSPTSEPTPHQKEWYSKERNP